MSDSMNERPVTAMSAKMTAKITSHDNERLCGVLESIYFKEPLSFVSIVDMIDMMETAFDVIGFPDKSLLPRTFGEAPARVRRQGTDIDSLREQLSAQLAAKHPELESVQDTSTPPVGTRRAVSENTLATFEIFVAYRHNAEWQGKLRWAEKNITKEFTSIVEMIRIIDEALRLAN